MASIAKFIADILVRLLPELVSFLSKKIAKMIEKSKKSKANKKAVKELKDARSKDDINNGFNDMP